MAKTLVKEYRATAQADNSIIEDANGSMWVTEWNEGGANYRTVFQTLIIEADLRDFRARTFNQIFNTDLNAWQTISANPDMISNDTTFVDAQTGAINESPLDKDGNLLPGLITEAQFDINLLSPEIHPLVSAAIKRKLNIQ